MKVKVLIGILIFLVVINLATIGSFLYYQWQKPVEITFPPLRQGMQPLHELNLDRAQRHQLRNLLLEFKAETKSLNDQVRVLEEEIFAMLQEDTSEHDLIDEKLEKIAGLRLEISKKIIDKFYNTRNFLSPMQQKHFFNALMKERPGLMGPGPRFRKGRPGPANPPPPSEDLRFE
jgi:Spy/CpxP family protein refolding chaperone